MTWHRPYEAHWARLALAIFLVSLLSACQTTPPPPAAASFSPQQIAVMEAYDFVESDGHWKLGMDGKLLFPFDQSNLGAGQLERLKAMAARLMEVGIARLRVDGHTDAMGNEQYNRQLSIRRAEAVRRALVAGGMKEGNIQAVGRGESRPIEDNSTMRGRKENRRVTIIVSPGDGTAF